MITIILDCGHGKYTKGKRSPNGELLEYDYNRQIGRRVGECLKELGIEFYYTYPLDDPRDLSLSARALFANKISKEKGAANVLLISLHSNAFGSTEWSSPEGWSIYTTKGYTKSDEYATTIWNEAEKVCKKYGRKIRKDISDSDPDFEQDFTVIFKTICPSVLVEQFFYTNKEEMEWMLTEEGKSACTEIIVNAIKRIEGIS